MVIKNEDLKLLCVAIVIRCGTDDNWDDIQFIGINPGNSGIFSGTSWDLMGYLDELC